MKSNSQSILAIALVSMLTGGFVLSLCGSAQASRRLHNEASKTYALLPPAGVGSSGSASDNDHKTSNAEGSVATATTTTHSTKGHGSNSGEPPIEDPPLPGYDGSGGTASAAHASDHGKH